MCDGIASMSVPMGDKNRGSLYVALIQFVWNQKYVVDSNLLSVCVGLPKRDFEVRVVHMM